MKTSQVLTRKMGEFNVLQRTSDGYFDGNALLNQWNAIPSNVRRKFSVFIDSPKTKEFVETIRKRESQCPNMDNGDLQAIKEIKGRNTKNGKTKDQIWMHPFLFIDFAMWINPEFKYDVIKFVHDQMIEYRNEAGNSYKILASAISQIVNREDMPKAMMSIAKAMNYVVYNDHAQQIRNKQADEIRLKELCELQKDIAKLINFGFINSFDQVRNFLRKLWSSKWQKMIMQS